MGKYTLILGLLIFFFGLPLSYAQTGSVSGTVTNAQTNEPLPGVNVGIQNLGMGAATNAEGKFEIAGIPEGTHTITASFVGFESKNRAVEVNVGATVELNFELASQTYVGDEVVVTALGLSSQERSLGYSVQQVEGEEINNSPETGVVNSLAGLTSGVEISNSSGQPGSSTQIVIRGSNSITGDNQPLFVVDGVPINNENDGAPGVGVLQGGSASNRVLDIDPSIIENVSILKGGAATALYGSRAANGVVQITTKGGREGNMQVDFNSSIRFDEAIIDGTQDEYLSGWQGYFANALPADRGGYVDPEAPITNTQANNSWGPHKDNVPQRVLDDLGVNEIATYDHLGDFYQRGVNTENSLTFAGGNEDGTYFLSASRLDQKGTVPTTSLTRTNLNLKVRKELLPANLTSNTRINYINTNNRWFRNGFRSGTRLTRFWPINLEMQPYQYDDGFNRLMGSTDSPYWQINETSQESDVNRVLLMQEFIYDITSWLNITGRFGLDRVGDFQQVHRNKRVRFTNDGSMVERKIDRSRINNDVILQMLERQITENFGVSALIGSHINMREATFNNINANDQNIPGFFDDSNFNTVNASRFSNKYHLMSFYGRTIFNYKDYLYLTLTGRNDWSSTLPKDNRSYFYPSASLGFIFTDLLELDEDSPLAFGKIRGSISQTGSDAPLYSLSTSYTSPNFTANFEGGPQSSNLTFPFRGTNGFIKQRQLGNPNLNPEMTTTYEVGMNLGFYNNRARLEATYYNETTKDQLYSTPASSATGFTNMLRNAGTIKNEGVELTLSGTPIRTEELQWNLTVNWSKNQSEVVSLAPGVQRLQLAGYANSGIQAREDAGYGVIWGSGYQRNENGQYIIQDDPSSANYGFPLAADTPKAIGSVQPNWRGNFRTNFRYKGFILSALMDVQQGGEVFNFDLNYTINRGTAEITEQRGTQMSDPDNEGYINPFVWEGVKESSGEPNDIALVRDQSFWRRYSNTHENFVEDGSFIKLRRISLGYRLPSNMLEKTPLRSASFTVTGRNLWIDTDFSYGDPQGSTYGSGSNGQGFYMFVTPSSRSVSFDLELGF